MKQTGLEDYGLHDPINLECSLLIRDQQINKKQYEANQMRISKQKLTPNINIKHLPEEETTAIIMPPTEEDENGNIIIYLDIDDRRYKKKLSNNNLLKIGEVLGDETDNWEGAKLTLIKNSFDKNKNDPEQPADIIDYVDILKVDPMKTPEEKV